MWFHNDDLKTLYGAPRFPAPAVDLREIFQPRFNKDTLSGKSLQKIPVARTRPNLKAHYERYNKFRNSFQRKRL